jgi:UDP-N-acetylmuramyl pentapeptide phosphotransferase/UDP-N-acetylglucosamine-1-phosphate transferase
MLNTIWNSSSLLVPAVWTAGLAFAVAMCLVLTQDWHGHLSIDSHEGIQKFHIHPTPRVGGLAIVLGLIAGSCLVNSNVRDLLWPLMLAGIPAFVAGLMEDITKKVSVRTRLVATMACGILGWLITGQSVTRVDLPGVDWLLSFTVISVAFTAFAVGGIANAVNIIDGFNGLSGGTVIIIFSGFASICISAGDTDLATVCLLLAAGVLGFLVVNWPFGKLFLGDGGAYFVGFAMAWTAILIPARHPEISAWATPLACGYPVLEVLFSIARRHRRGLNPGDPDRLHLHSLVKKRLVLQLFPHATSLVRNSLTGMTMWLAALVPVGIATHFSMDTRGLVLGFVFCAVLYSMVYARLTRFKWSLPA